jgi:hypothetical protein
MNMNSFNQLLSQRFVTLMVAIFALTICLPTFANSAADRADSGKSVDSKSDTAPPQSIEWLTSYKAAHAKAKQEGRMLLINFMPKEGSSAQRQLDDGIKTDEVLRRRLHSVVMLRLPYGYESDIAGVEGALVKHAAFKELNGETGLVILDLKNSKAPYYGKVVTALPFSSGKYYRWQPNHLKVALNLPSGSITQRTMTWAVRIHPESPASTAGKSDPVLAQVATQHSEYQARVQVQGHQGFENRYQLVRSQTSAGDASEVVAESWPDQNLIDSCIDCVDSWRHSPGHWQAVRGRHRLFSYDIRRGNNGIWYGTGIFAN